MQKKLYFVDMVRRLEDFWRKRGFLVVFTWDMPKGAGTSSPYTFFWSLGGKPCNVAYLEPCRRPGDGRYGDSPNRLGRFYQYQVIAKPAPGDIRAIYESSLESLGLSIGDHELRYVEDDWESPTLGASGIGWEVWLDGLEITQFTYFQNFAGMELGRIPVEITYGLERIAMYLQGVDSIFDIAWDQNYLYGDVFHRNYEREFSHYHFEEYDAGRGFALFEETLREAKHLIERRLVLPAYECILNLSHIFNSLDARGAISIEERNRLIADTRNVAKQVARVYIEKNDEQAGRQHTAGSIQGKE
ncbi:glycine--tRNA ligase subunit alpha [Elusimicrobiota bacterium]